MNKQLADMITKDLRTAREAWGETVEALDKLLLIDFENVDDSLTAPIIEAARGMREKAVMDSTMSNLAFVIFNELSK